MGKLIKIVKRKICRLPRWVIALVPLIVTIIVSVMAYPMYLCSLLSRKNKQPIYPPKEMTYDDIEHQFYEYMFVQELCTHRHIDMETVCREMGVSPEAFAQYLKERLSTSFKEVLHECRIEEAKDLWEKSGTTPICQVARAVGYGNSVAFLLHFLKHDIRLEKKNLAHNVNNGRKDKRQSENSQIYQ